MIGLSQQFLEAIIGTLFVIYLGVLWVFVRFCVNCWRTCEPRTFWVWYEKARGAIALTIKMLGTTLFLGPVWFYFHLENTNRDPKMFMPMFLVLVSIGAVLAIVGGVCVVRQLLPPKYEITAPLAVAILALAFGIGMAM